MGNDFLKSRGVPPPPNFTEGGYGSPHPLKLPMTADQSLYSSFCTYSTLHTLQWSLYILHITNLTLYILQIKLNTVLSTLHSLYFRFYILHYNFTLYIIQINLYTLLSAIYTLHSAVQSLQRNTLNILYSKILHSSLWTFHFFCNLYTPKIYFVHSPINFLCVLQLYRYLQSILCILLSFHCMVLHSTLLSYFKLFKDMLYLKTVNVVNLRYWSF